MQQQNHAQFPRPAIVGAIAAAILLSGVAIAAYIVFVKAPTDLAHNTAQGIREFFNFTPRVSIEQTVIIEENTPILEVATLSRTLTVDHRWSHTWVSSTKTLHVRGVFTAKAGFDLRHPFEINIEKNPLRVIATLPPPQLLSLQMDRYTVIQDESGWWNRISDDDREEAFEELSATAFARAEASGILQEALATAESRIREIVERNGSTVEFRHMEILERRDPGE
ncbi:MAG: DUF4230 domain-containing protein [Bacteroidetes bacterium]|nr:DUF4230 domain-containing protein [Bacteroidota bacterium]